MSRQTPLTEKRRRGPKPTGVGTLIGVRLQPEPLAILDKWIASFPEAERPTRPEAIRRIMEGWSQTCDFAPMWEGFVMPSLKREDPKGKA